MAQENSYQIEQFDPEVLREYDIRGIVDKNITENTAYTIGRVFGYIVFEKLKSNNISLGYDGRLTSPKLYKALSTGLKDAGANVKSIGMCPTPMLYFADYYLKTDAALMITGSHNPSEYNGFKMVMDKHSFFSENIQKFKTILKTIKLEKKEGSIEHIDIIDAYVERVLKNISIKNKLKISWDIGNGAMGVIINKLISKLKNTENILLNQDVDGNFPNHHPDPTVPKNMEQLIESVKKNKCDIGLAFDGDGDRLGVVDNSGKIIWADQYMLILCSEIANLYQSPKVIMDVKCSKVFFDEAKKLGCEPLMERTGHSPIKEKMKEIKSPLSGEMSGHVCYGDDFYGLESFKVVAEYYQNGGADFSMVAFQLDNTLSDFGSVTRGLCTLDGDKLDTVIETDGLQMSSDGMKSDRKIVLSGKEPVSMNVWGFTPDLFFYLESMFIEFLEKEGKEIFKERI